MMTRAKSLAPFERIDHAARVFTRVLWTRCRDTLQIVERVVCAECSESAHGVRCGNGVIEVLAQDRDDVGAGRSREQRFRARSSLGIVICEQRSDDARARSLNILRRAEEKSAPRKIGVRRVERGESLRGTRAFRFLRARGEPRHEHAGRKGRHDH